MKIFVYTTVFAPSVGGIEEMAKLLCTEFTALGHEVVVATETPGTADMPFEVVRRPSRLQMRQLLSWCDVHMQANISLKAAWVWLFAFQKSIYMHQNVYQRDDCTKSLIQVVKTTLARDTPGIANSTYTAARTGAEHVILNAYDDTTFGPAPAWESKDRDLVFLGRLVSQKGCETLIDALGRLAARGQRPALTVIGDGPDREQLARQADETGVVDQVTFEGKLTGKALAMELARHRVMVVPSRYEEPFGIVALEGLASGCVLVVSERGGLTDAIGGHGFTFPNGDAEALADRLEGILSDIETARHCLDGVDRHLAQCKARAVAQNYIAVFDQRIRRRT